MKSYLDWAIYACIVAVIVLAVTCIFSIIFSKKDFINTVGILRRTVFSKIKNKSGD